jgi:hypothetical protein
MDFYALNFLRMQDGSHKKLWVPALCLEGGYSLEDYKSSGTLAEAPQKVKTKYGVRCSAAETF